MLFAGYRAKWRIICHIYFNLYILTTAITDLLQPAMTVTLALVSPCQSKDSDSVAFVLNVLYHLFHVLTHLYEILVQNPFPFVP